MPASLIRGILTLTVLGIVTAAVLASPVSASRTDTAGRQWVRNLVNTKVGTLRADLTSALRDQRTSGYSAGLVGPVALNAGGTDRVILSLEVGAAGSYVVTAKLWWNPIISTSTGVGGEIDCDLLAEQDFDTSRESGNSDFDYGTLELSLAHNFQVPGTVFLRCRDEFSGGNAVEVHNVRMIAFEVNDLTETAPARPAETAPARPAEPSAPQRPTP